MASAPVWGRMPGKEVKFDDLKDDVREVFAERLREQVLPGLRKAATIKVVAPVGGGK